MSQGLKRALLIDFNERHYRGWNLAGNRNELVDFEVHLGGDPQHDVSRAYISGRFG